MTTLLAAASARADIYGYIDAEGIAHFAAEKVDERYQLFMQGTTALDSSRLPQGAAASRQTPLLAYLSQHPNLKKFEPLLEQAAKEFSLDPALLKAVMAAESGFNPAAISPKGAIGLMQVMPATAERYGLQADRKKSVEQKLSDPKTNIRLGARYLRDLHKLFPAKPDLVIASYNAGEGAVQRYNNTVPPYPETRNYVQLVTQFYRLYKPSVAGVAVEGAASKRIHITIPGRRNMPATILE
jgi:soluble lytic murein transglycosylase-like protein